MRYFAAILLIILSGCSFGPVPTKPTKYYTLEPVVVKKYSRKNGVLAIDTPQTERGLQSNSMLYSEREFQINAYLFNKWSASPPSLLQELLLESFSRSGAFKAVVTSKYASSANWVLKMHILRWHQSFLEKPSQIEVAFVINVYDQKKAKIVASKMFEKAISCETDDAYGGVVAMNDAMEDLIPRVHSFVSRYAR